MNADYRIVNVEGNSNKFKTNIKVGFKSEEDINDFIKKSGCKKRNFKSFQD